MRRPLSGSPIAMRLALHAPQNRWIDSIVGIFWSDSEAARPVLHMHSALFDAFRARAF